MSDTSVKVKVYKNPDRDKRPPYKPYVPQYQVMGHEPKKHENSAVPGLAEMKVAPYQPLPLDNPRAKRMPLRQPYAEATISPVGRGPVPNVGNNMEHTWSSVDGEVIDDISGVAVSAGDDMIDNNDFVTDQAMGYPNGLMAADISVPSQHGVITLEPDIPELAIEANKLEYQQSNITDDTGGLLSIVSGLSDDAYLLIVAGVPVCSGPKEEIEDQARAMVFGEHELCDGNPIEIDDIVILRRIKVKVGLFLE